jgi:uncharacterized repeat protein (TIGR01451 family)
MPGFTRTDSTPVGGTGTLTATAPTLMSGVTAIFTLVVKASASDANGSTISNTASVSSSTADPNTANNSSTVNSTVATAAGLVVNKTGPSTVIINTDVTYTITLTNTGPSDAQNVNLTDVVPAGTTFVSESQTSGPAFALGTPPAGSGGTVSDSIATFASGASATFILVVHASPSDINGSTIVNTATVSSSTSSTSATTSSTVASVAVARVPPFVSVALTAFGPVMELVDAQGNLTQFDFLGAHPLGGGYRSASVAFTSFGEVLVTVNQAGIMTQFDALGAHPLGGGVLDASVAFGPAGEILDVVSLDGTLRQFDFLGVHTLGFGVLSVGVAFSNSSAGEVLEVIYNTGEMIQYDLNGAHPLLAGVLSASAAFNITPPQGPPFPVVAIPGGPPFITPVEILDAIFADGLLKQADGFGVHVLSRLF